MRPVEFVHERWAARRRVRILGQLIAKLLPANARVLDVGCGDGEIDAFVGRERADLEIIGIDVSPRPGAMIPVQKFDGRSLPFPDASFDAVVFVDVLHHAEEAELLLSEAVRVSRAAVVIKDHLLQGVLAGATLRFMDRTGNRRHGVALPHDYWPPEEWDRVLAQAGLEIELWQERLGLYWGPASLVFDRRLHFLARLSVAR